MLFPGPTNPSDPETEYVPTQIIAEAFREKGYDGIAYKSSYGKGHNVVLFDLDVVEIVGRWLAETNDINFDFKHFSIGEGKNLVIKTEKSPEKVVKWNRLRFKYKPSSIKTLFIGESPPKLKGRKFFYEGGELTKHTKLAFQKAHNDFETDFSTEQFLEKFKKNGFYLDDISHLPVAGLTASERNYQLLKSLD